MGSGVQHTRTVAGSPAPADWGNRTVDSLRYRWRALVGLGVGLAAWVALHALGFLPGAAVLYAWNLTLLVYLATTLALILNATPDQVRTQAGREDEGRVVIMAMIVAAVLLSVAGIVYAGRERGMADPSGPFDARARLDDDPGPVHPALRPPLLR